MNHFLRNFSCIIAFSFCFAGCQSQKLLEISPASRQLVLVTSLDENSITATLRRFEKKAAQWEQVGEAHPVTLGRTGLAPGDGIHDPQIFGKAKPKREGDGKSPAGIFRFGNAFGYAKEAAFKLHYTHSSDAIECVDDSGSGFYNQLVDNTLMTRDWSSSEFMRRQDEQYRWGIVVHHNTPAKPMGGSCIFFHIWKAPGEATSGCTAMTEKNLLVLMAWLDPNNEPLLVQLTEKDYSVFQKKYVLPAFR